MFLSNYPSVWDDRLAKSQLIF